MSQESHSAPDIATIVAEVPFANPEHARAALLRVVERVPASVMTAVGPLLGESADPDLALTLFDRLVESSRGAEAIRLFERYSFLTHYVIAIFSTSKWLGETLLANTDLLSTFARDRALDQMRSVEDLHEAFARFRSRSFDSDLPLTLARFKRREYVRILLRDVLGLATLAETTAEISALSDVLITEALAICESSLRTRYGTPQYIDDEGRNVPAEFAVLSLGKLGGCELNYSSDIDLLFLYSDGPDAGTTSISAHEFFTRLAQELTDVLSRVTPEGSVFRIDLRLRPRGHEGEPTISVGNAIGYYSRIAQDWELQALIKARHSAGSRTISKAFLKGVQPFVYRPEINFAAIKTALVSLQKVHKKTLRGIEGRHAPRTIDIKIDHGGIRDIEFLVQCLQRVYGGAEPWLRSGGTLFSLSKLHDKEHFTGKDCNTLAHAYTFLRKVEHLLQLRHGQQTHKLPTSARELSRLYRATMRDKGADDPHALMREVRSSMQSVRTIYDRVVLQQQTVEERGLERPPQTRGGWIPSGTSQPTASRLMTDCPALLELAESTKLGSSARKNIHRFLASASTSGERYRTLLKNADAVRRAMPLFEHSTFLTDILARHPEQIAEVAAERVSEAANLGLDGVVVGPEQAECARRVLRWEFQRRLVRTASQSILFHPAIWQTLAEHTTTADALIAAALRLAQHPEAISIWAVGRLGSREFDVLSDADLLFIRDEDADAAKAARSAEAVMEMLSAYTRDGTIMTVDTRLRPHGRSGDLVCTVSQLETYFAGEAQAWEALTFAKARCIVGCESVKARVEMAIAHLNERFRNEAALKGELEIMRKRLDEADSNANLKTGPGGAYDIDFITGYLGIRTGAALCGLNAAERIALLETNGALEGAEAATLHKAAALYRCAEHVTRLVEGKTRKWLPANAAAASSVETLASAILGLQFARGLEAELRSSMAEVRVVFNAVFCD